MPRATFYPINLNFTLADVYINLKEFDKALGLIESYLIVKIHLGERMIEIINLNRFNGFLPDTKALPES